ncbi:hypothetical protein KSP40_PGU016022 [Platanthera guangdongensis]|uniref:Uncharacterized protein n=1 Tax=Platanthera guangdongensis TaxID=2320717 RepID=A0ABR2LYY7_9ASPA
MHSVQTTILFSLEAVQELVQWDRMLKLQSTNGSFLDSPAATAAAYLNTRDKKCLEYLTYIVRTFEDHAVHIVVRSGVDIRDYAGDVLEYYKDGDDRFLCYTGETHQGFSDFFSLYRFSQIAFPGEKILKQAKSFAKQRLVNGIEDNHVYDKWALKKALDKERKLQVQEYLNERVRKDAKQIASFKEHVELVKKGLAISIRLLPSMFLMGNVITENVQNLDHRSIIHEQLTSYLALLDPVTEEWMAVSLYKKEHHCTEKDAIRYIEEKIDDAFAELAHEYLKPNKSIPQSCRRLFFEHGRIVRFYLDKVRNDHNSKTIERLYTLAL